MVVPFAEITTQNRAGVGTKIAAHDFCKWLMGADLWIVMHKALTRGMKRASIFGGILLLILTLAASGLVFYLKNLDFNSYKPILQTAVLEQTGRSLRIDGDLQLKISLHPSLIVSGLHLSNAAGGSRASMLDVERAELEISLLPLLSGHLHVDRVVLIRPDILLETLPAGGNNWHFSGTAASAVENSDNSPFQSVILLPEVHRLFIRAAKLTYRNAISGQETTLKLAELALWQQGKAHDALLKFRGNGRYKETKLDVQGSVDSPGSLFANAETELTMNINFADTKFVLAGTVAQPLDGKGLALNLAVDSKGIAAPAKIFGVAVGRDFPLHFKLRLKDAGNVLLFTNINAKLADSDVSGHLLLRLEKVRPRLEGELTSASFDVVRLLPKVKKTPVAPQKQRILPAEPLATSVLNTLDMQLAYTAKYLRLPDLALSDVQTDISLHKGQLQMPFTALFSDGKVEGKLNIQANKPVPDFTLSLKARGIKPGELLPPAEGKNALIEGAPLNMDISLKGSGISVAEILAHANGRMLLQFGEGRLKSQAMGLLGGDVLVSLFDRINPFSDKQDYSELHCGVVNFRITDGIMHSERGIAFETARMNMLSEGEINLQNERINLHISTEPREGLGLDVANLVNVVKLGGTLGKPGIAVDAVKTGMVAARTVGAVATGGLSLLGESLVKRVIADKTPCKTALEMK